MIPVKIIINKYCIESFTYHFNDDFDLVLFVWIVFNKIKFGLLLFWLCVWMIKWWLCCAVFVLCCCCSNNLLIMTLLCYSFTTCQDWLLYLHNHNGEQLQCFLWCCCFYFYYYVSTANYPRRIVVLQSVIVVVSHAVQLVSPLSNFERIFILEFRD